MNLKADIHLPDFFQAIHACRGEVFFQTPEGDQLNLKSTLSQFVFTAALAGQVPIPDGTLCCEEKDVPILRPFLEE